MKLIPLSLLLLFLISSIAQASAGTVLYPSNSTNNQDAINDALGDGDVYLSAGTYLVDGPVNIGSDRVLTGDSDAIIKVSSTSSRWFVGSVGIISCKGSVKNVEISGFQINGNLGAFPASYANSHEPHKKDCMRCIIIHGDSGNYADNIKIHDMKLYDSFSDGMQIYYARNVAVYNNFISNCQHEGVFWSVVIDSEMYGNKIAGITSDCMRLDNSINCKVYDNVLFSYDGTNTNGAYKGGENGLQVGDAGSSHGYDASKKPTTTTNIEITNNTFANNGLKAIALGSNTDNNVYVHDNKFIGVAELKTMGISVETNISYENPPTFEQSERIFSSIFDILQVELIGQASQNSTIYVDGKKHDTEVTKSMGSVEQHDLGNLPYTLVSIPSNGLRMVRYEVGGKSAEQTVMIGERQGLSTVYTNVSTWSGELGHQGDLLYLDGVIQAEDIKVTCYTPKGSFEPKLNVILIEKHKGIFNPFILFYLAALLPLIGFILFTTWILFSKH